MPAVESVCAYARALIARDDAAGALAFLESAKPLAGKDGPQICGAEFAAALIAADEAPAAPPTASASDAVCTDAEALIAEGFPERALALLDAAKPLAGKDEGQICPDALQHALHEIHAGSPVPDSPARWFSGLVGDLTAPRDVVEIGLGLALALVVLARLVATWVPCWPRMGRGGATWLVLGGLLPLLLGAAGLAMAVTGAGGPRTWTAFWAAVTVAVGGVLLLAAGLATRLRLTIECTGATGTADVPLVGRILARLGELGIEPARGVEVPRGTDVEVLGGSALAGLPEGRVAKSVVTLLRGVLGTSPWRVLVDAQKDGVYAVSMTRNGRAMGSATVCTDLIDLPDDDAGKKARGTVDLTTLVAAFILATLARHHRGFEGLAGASDWLSIGLHAAATTQDNLAEEHQRELLALAVERDPKNWPAQVALRNTLWRRSTAPDELKQYVDWLGASVGTCPSETLKLRMRTTRALASVNLYYASHEPPFVRSDLLEGTRDPVVELLLAMRMAPSGELLEQTRGVAAGLALTLAPQAEEVVSQSTADRRSGRRARRLASEVARESDAVAKSAGLMLDDGAAEVRQPGEDFAMKAAALEGSPGPKAAYAWACSYATLRDVALGARDPQPIGDDPAVKLSATLAKRAVRHLRVARAIKDVRAWVGDDPQLRTLRESAEYRKEFLSKPRSDLFAIEPLASHAARLKDAGFTTSDLLRDVATRPTGTALLINAPTRAAIAELAHLHASLCKRDAFLRRYAVEVLVELIGQERASRRVIAELPDEPARSDLADRVAAAVRQRLWLVDPDDGPHVGTQDDLAARLAARIATWLVLVVN